MSYRVVIAALLSLGIGLAGGYFASRWYGSSSPSSAAAVEKEDEHDHGKLAEGIVVSDKARQNLNLIVGPVELTDYWRSLSVPGSVVERPGRSEILVTTTVNGIVRDVFAVPGQAVAAGAPLFRLQITDNLLASAQAGLLKTIQELASIRAEIDRLQPLVEQGTVPEAKIIQFKYDLRQKEQTRESQTQELLVRGLSNEQVDAILREGKLIREFVVSAPPIDEVVSDIRGSLADLKNSPSPAYTVESFGAFKGKHIQVGDELCELALHSSLFVEGRAFEKESEAIGAALDNGYVVTATFEVGEDRQVVREKLKILYMENVVDPESRTFHFYLPLENEVLADKEGPDGEIYRSWRFKPGQKAILRIPVEQWKNRFVLPSEAVVFEGLDAFVFLANGNLFERRAVVVEYEDADKVVLANDGSLFPGDMIAMNRAYQLNLAMKKAAGEGGGGHGHDHHGHSH